MVEPGKAADLVLLSADAIADIRNLERVEWVMRGGVRYATAGFRTRE